ncbi:cytochrome b/b6 domain-containing protein [Phenylobacterium immobile]|uniref:cytochrome b/b6 domain-containing protein n=1 Tax=Phenylobacterium immobile TaxID=21 RepID=UPI000AC40BB2|nr:cytochrome b/b6 domain-containing protein [Phenylobacterium immobile]
MAKDRQGEDRTVRRHAGLVRLTHWINALVLLFLLMSGLQILRAHPALYWGDVATFADPWAAFGEIPGWLTIPSFRDLADGRRWHFFFAWALVFNGAVYLVWGLTRGHLRRDLLPTAEELKPRSLWRDVVEHARLRFPKGEAALRYNPLQKLTYLAVIFGLLPLMLATGLSMSPGMNAAWPWLPELFGGRQSARTFHFLSASALVAFVAVHLAMVVASGPINNLRGMITGRVHLETER